MKTVSQYLRNHLLKKVNNPIIQINIGELLRSEWSIKFEKLMRNRLVMGAFRYGNLYAGNKHQYDRISAIIARAQQYQLEGNDELLVDIANLCLIEFEIGKHPKKHFTSIDDGPHVSCG